MAVFLSPAWFDAATAPGAAEPEGPVEGDPQVVVEHVVEGAPGGTVTYRVVLAPGRARIVWPVPEGSAEADLRMTAPWPTSVAIAKGEMSTQRALMAGLVRVNGNPGRLSEVGPGVAGLDPVPPEVRASTTFEEPSAPTG